MLHCLRSGGGRFFQKYHAGILHMEIKPGCFGYTEQRGVSFLTFSDRKPEKSKKINGFLDTDFFF